MSVKQKIISIVNVFETGVPNGKYDAIALYYDGPNVDGKYIKQITYGRSQTTEFGGLKRLLELYMQNQPAYNPLFDKYIQLVRKLPSLCTDTVFLDLLVQTARIDPIMQSTQDEFFDIYYYQPAEFFFMGNKFKYPLSMLVIYDSFIHSGGILPLLRQRFPEKTPVNGGNEKVWIQQYTETRLDWLKTHVKPILRKTVYRPLCFLEQINNNNWNLSDKVNANGFIII